MSGPTVDLAKAAELCGLSVSTLRRKRDALLEAGATRHDGSWEIPITSLISLGLMQNVTPPDTSMTRRTDSPDTRHDGSQKTAFDASFQEQRQLVEELRAQLLQKDKELAVPNTSKAYLEQLLLEKDKRLALREAPPSPVESSTPPTPPKPRWWKR